MAATVLNIDAIVSDPKIRSGRPTIAGTGICVSDLIITHKSGDKLSPEQLADNFRLNLGEVYAALSYYHFHRAEIDQEIETNSQEARQLIEKLESQERLTRLD